MKTVREPPAPLTPELFCAVNKAIWEVSIQEGKIPRAARRVLRSVVFGCEYSPRDVETLGRHFDRMEREKASPAPKAGNLVAFPAA